EEVNGSLGPGGIGDLRQRRVADRTEGPEGALLLGDLETVLLRDRADLAVGVGPRSSLAHPLDKGLDLARLQLRLRRHLRLAGVVNGLDEQALVRLAWDNRRPRIAAVHQGG